MSNDQIDRLLRVAALPRKRGNWLRFAQEEGLTRTQVFYMRKKLGVVTAIKHTTREQVDKIAAFAATNPMRGGWAAFARREGLSPYTVIHWRKKLGLLPT